MLPALLLACSLFATSGDPLAYSNRDLRFTLPAGWELQAEKVLEKPAPITLAQFIRKDPSGRIQFLQVESMPLPPGSMGLPAEWHIRKNLGVRARLFRSNPRSQEIRVSEGIHELNGRKLLGLQLGWSPKDAQDRSTAAFSPFNFSSEIQSALSGGARPVEMEGWVIPVFPDDFPLRERFIQVEWVAFRPLGEPATPSGDLDGLLAGAAFLPELPPVLSAAWKGDLPALLQLVPDAKAAQAGLAPHGMTPLIAAAKGGRSAAVKLLLDRGAGVKRPDDRGATALFAAAEMGHAETLAALLAAGGDPESRLSKSRLTPLMAAAFSGKLATVQALLDARVPVDAVDEKGYSALILAAETGLPEAVRALLKAGAKPDRLSKAGESALLIAADFGHLQVVEALLEGDANVDVRNENGEVPLSFAAYRGHEEIARALLARKASLDLASRKGATPLILAVLGNQPALVRLLLAAGAKRDPKCKGLTAYESARQLGNPEVVKAFQDAGERP